METAKDITERQRVEEALSLNELQVHALLQLHEMADQPMQMIIDFALEKAIELTRSKACYLAFVNADETVLTTHLWPKGQRAAELAPQINPLAEAGRWAEAVRQRQPVIANQDALPNCFETGAPDGVELMRHMDVPVFEGERIVAVAGVGNKETPYDENDVRQLMLLLLGMWRLVQRKQGEDRLRATADALRRSEAYLVEAQWLTHTGSWADDGTARANTPGRPGQIPPHLRNGDPAESRCRTRIQNHVTGRKRQICPYHRPSGFECGWGVG
jgi:two-component system phosphate regulon sensor histidine kinase PhoR